MPSQETLHSHSPIKPRAIATTTMVCRSANLASVAYPAAIRLLPPPSWGRVGAGPPPSCLPAFIDASSIQPPIHREQPAQACGLGAELRRGHHVDAPRPGEVVHQHVDDPPRP